MNDPPTPIIPVDMLLAFVNNTLTWRAAATDSRTGASLGRLWVAISNLGDVMEEQYLILRQGAAGVEWALTDLPEGHAPHLMTRETFDLLCEGARNDSQDTEPSPGEAIYLDREGGRQSWRLAIDWDEATRTPIATAIRATGERA